MKRQKKWATILVLLLLVYVVTINAPYYYTAARSLFIEAHTEDVPTNYVPEGNPLLILHGFNPTYSGRISEFTMHGLQAALASDLGYRDAGIYTPEVSCAELCYTTTPTVLRATYLEQYDLVDIDTYSENLAAIVDRITSCTGAEKIDIIGYSMGGIVARNYIKRQVDAGEEVPVEKLIMVGTPNHGELYSFAGLDSYLIKDGKGVVALDFTGLSEEHTFMEALNHGDESPGDVKYYTIAGEYDDIGDGVVRAESVSVEGEVWHRRVRCSHILLKDPSQCIGAYAAIKAALEKEK